jgi:uncharacterized protein
VVPLALHGVGLRTCHFPAWLSGTHRVGLVEAISENFAGRGGRPRAVLERVRKDSEVVLHGVSMSIGGMDPLDEVMLRNVRELAQQIGAAWISEHLSFGTAHGYSGYDLWPLPFTEAAIHHLVSRIAHAQELLGMRIAFENPSSYVRYACDSMSECEFMSEVAERADCDILLDLNNVIVNAHNHGFSAQGFVEGLPSKRIRQIHLAGHDVCETHLFDGHASPIPDSVWALYEHCIAKHGAIASIVERDEHIPPLEDVIAESLRVQEIERHVLHS